MTNPAVVANEREQLKLCIYLIGLLIMYCRFCGGFSLPFFGGTGGRATVKV